MTYEWDDEKSDANRRLRGFAFDIIEAVDWSATYGPEIQYVNGEERDFWIGPIYGKLYAIVTTDRASVRRVISMRKITKHEYRLWSREVRDEGI